MTTVCILRNYTPNRQSVSFGLLNPVGREVWSVPGVVFESQYHRLFKGTYPDIMSYYFDNEKRAKNIIFYYSKRCISAFWVQKAELWHYLRGALESSCRELSSNTGLSPGGASHPHRNKKLTSFTMEVTPRHLKIIDMARRICRANILIAEANG